MRRNQAGLGTVFSMWKALGFGQITWFISIYVNLEAHIFLGCISVWLEAVKVSRHSLLLNDFIARYIVISTLLIGVLLVEAGLRVLGC